ncbi:MAG: hypothetical protein ABIW82_00205 [Dokdonella sp.]
MVFKATWACHFDPENHVGVVRICRLRKKVDSPAPDPRREIEAAVKAIGLRDFRRELRAYTRAVRSILLAAIFNRMPGEIERLLGEVTSGCDNIEPDSRTPLMRLRTLLHRCNMSAGKTKRYGCRAHVARLQRWLFYADAIVADSFHRRSTDMVHA